jgi:hypothetical protein
MTWVAPDRLGDWTVTLTVHDKEGGAVARSVSISVADNYSAGHRPAHAGRIGGHCGRINHRHLLGVGPGERRPVLRLEGPTEVTSQG